MRRSAFALAGLSVLAACAPTVVPQPAAAPPPPPARPAPPAPQPLDWEDWPVTPGNWTYARDSRSSIARFGATGSVAAWVRCDLASRSVAIGRAGGGAAATVMLAIRTSFGVLQWPAQTVASPVAGVEAARGASDPGLDQIAFSRGRFTLELPGAPPLVAPSWAEPARVVEDCRG